MGQDGWKHIPSPPWVEQSLAEQSQEDRRILQAPKILEFCATRLFQYGAKTGLLSPKVACLGSQHPSLKVKSPLQHRAEIWLEIITSRDATHILTVRRLPGRLCFRVFSSTKPFKCYSYTIVFGVDSGCSDWLGLPETQKMTFETQLLQ